MNAQHSAQQATLTSSNGEVAVGIGGLTVRSATVAAYSLSQLPGEGPQLVLQLHDDAEARFEGMARVAVAQAPDPGPAAAEFLAAIDPAELQRAALTRFDLGTGPHSLTQAMLTQLQEWACGD